MGLAVLILIGFDGLDHQEAEAGLFQQRLVVQDDVIPKFILLQDLSQMVDVVKMQPQHAVLMQSMVILNGKLHQRKQQELY